MALRRLGWAVAAMVAMGGCSASAINDAPFSQIVTPGNTQVPLPEGDWQLLASRTNTSGRTMGGGIDNQHSVEVEYGKVESGVLTAVAYVSTSADAPSSGGYGTGLGCLHPTNPDYVYLSDARGASPNGIDCTLVRGNRAFNLPGVNSTDLYRESYEKAKALGGFARQTVEVNFAQAHNFRYMNYTVWFFPERAGVPVRNVSWRVDQLAAPTRSYVDGIVAWAKRFRGAVSLGTDYRL